MSMYRMAGAADPATGAASTDDEFADAIRAHFGTDALPPEPSETPVDDPAVETEPGEGEGPSPLPSPSPEPEAEPGDDGGFVETPADLTPPEPAPEPTPEPDLPPPAAPEFDLNELFERHYGTRPTPGEMSALLSFVDQVQRLSPDQQAALNAIMSGQPVPATPPTGPSPYAPQPAPPSPAYSQHTAPQFPSEVPDFADLTPEARAYLEPLYRQQTEISARLAAAEAETARRNLEAQQQQIVSGIQAASNQFVAEYGAVLTPADLVLLETRAQQSGQFPLMMQQANNDPARAYRNLLDALSYSDPAIRDKIVGISAPVTDTPADLERKSKASAVSAGGQAGRRISPLGQAAESIPSDPEGARQWAINEISRTTGMPRIS